MTNKVVKIMREPAIIAGLTKNKLNLKIESANTRAI